MDGTDASFALPVSLRIPYHNCDEISTSDDEGIFAYFNIKLAEVTEHYPVIQFKEVNHDKDHIHLLVSIPPTMAVGKVVGIIKQNTSRELKQKFPFVKQVYYGTEAVWSEGYFVSTVGINEQTIQSYIKHQGQKDAGQTKFELR